MKKKNSINILQETVNCVFTREMTWHTGNCYNDTGVGNNDLAVL